MGRDKEHNPDPNENAARIVAESAGDNTSIPLTDVEAAWSEWSSQTQNVDERGMELLRAAFEAGYEANKRGSAAEMGRRGGRKGGPARAAKLTKEQRSEIARRAAMARWEKE